MKDFTLEGDNYGWKGISEHRLHHLSAFGLFFWTNCIAQEFLGIAAFSLHLWWINGNFSTQSIWVQWVLVREVRDESNSNEPTSNTTVVDVVSILSELNMKSIFGPLVSFQQFRHSELICRYLICDKDVREKIMCRFAASQGFVTPISDVTGTTEIDQSLFLLSEQHDVEVSLA